MDRVMGHTAHRVQVARDNEDVKPLNEGVVEQKHDRCGIPGPFRIPEKHLPNVADISYLWVTQAKFPFIKNQYLNWTVVEEEKKHCHTKPRGMCTAQMQLGRPSG